MDDILGEIRLFGFGFVPRNYLSCYGQLLNISQYRALYDLLGTTYGGDGRVSFALPDLRERALLGAGTGAGLTPRPRGAAVGQWKVALTEEEMPLHAHPLSGTVLVTQDSASLPSPEGAYLAGLSGNDYSEDVDGNTMAGGLATGLALPIGSGEAHLNMMPSMIMHYAICVNGQFPI